MKKQDIKILTRIVLGSSSYYKIADYVHFKKLKKKSPKLRDSIKENIQFKNLYQGRRCFVLGNGPSLRDFDLSLLADEYVFSVNSFNLVQGYEKARTNAHLWMDLSCFGLREDIKEDEDLLWKDFEDISAQNCLSFVPAAAYDFVKKTHLDELLNIHYVFTDRSFLDGDLTDIDFTRGVYACSTVVQMAVQLAIYMGFREIYLHGCDATNVITHLNTIAGLQNKDMHAYDAKKDVIEDNVKKLLKTWDTHDFLYDHYYLFLGYERLRKYCDQQGIILNNCSTGSLITEIEKISLRRILNA